MDEPLKINKSDDNNREQEQETRLHNDVIMLHLLQLQLWSAQYQTKGRFSTSEVTVALVSGITTSMTTVTSMM